jgi:hypothetical protein
VKSGPTSLAASRESCTGPSASSSPNYGATNECQGDENGDIDPLGAMDLLALFLVPLWSLMYE